MLRRPEVDYRRPRTIDDHWAGDTVTFVCHSSGIFGPSPPNYLLILFVTQTGELQSESSEVSALMKSREKPFQLAGKWYTPTVLPPRFRVER